MRAKHIFVATLAFAAMSCVVPTVHRSASAQAIAAGGGRPFVTGFTPVIGRNGGVGGVDVDVAGVVSRVQQSDNAELAARRANAIRGVSKEIRKWNAMRKVSLRRLNDDIGRHVDAKKPLSMTHLYLAGLQRIEYVFVYPELGDIVIAGPAEGWQMREGFAVGDTTGQAALRLDDLLDALRGNAAAADGADGISCSIDPTPEGMARVQNVLRRRDTRVSEAMLKGLEQQLGDQVVTLTGIRTNSHFARVMLSADYMMKRIAMNLEPSGVGDLPSYLELMKRGRGATQVSAPRWWIATDYETAERDEDGLAWRFQGRGVKAMSEHAYLNDRGQLVNTRAASPLAKQWADRFTDRYDQLAEQTPVFGQLRACIDLALLSALIQQEALIERAETQLDWLTDSSKLSGEAFAVPQRVPSVASALHRRGGWIVTVSGGVDLDTWNVLNGVEIQPKLQQPRKEAKSEAQNWWWD